MARPTDEHEAAIWDDGENNGWGQGFKDGERPWKREIKRLKENQLEFKEQVADLLRDMVEKYITGVVDTSDNTLTMKKLLQYHCHIIDSDFIEDLFDDGNESEY